MRIASAEHGVGFDDLPPFKVNVLPARLAEDEAGPREAPGWGILASVACASLVALALPRRSVARAADAPRSG